MKSKDILFMIVVIGIILAGIVASTLLGIKVLSLMFVMIFAGIIMGIMFNIALAKKFYDAEGIIGGAVVGLFMFILGGGFAVS